MSLKRTFDDLTVEQVEAFPAQGREESLYLEFKTTASADLSKKDDKRIFSQAVAGFANAEGGVIVWGIDARRNSDGIDCATAPKPIADPVLFVARLRDLTIDCASPPVDGVEHRALTKSDGTGYAATLIPESDRGPHMAKLGENRYIRRHAASFQVMEHNEIADMFGRRPRPRLALTYRVVSTGTNARIAIGIHNTGRASARAPYLAFETTGPFTRSQYGLNGSGFHGLPMIPSLGQHLAFRHGDSTFVIHPGVTLEVTLVSMGIKPRDAPTADLDINYELCAEDLPLERGVLKIPLGELL